MSPEPKSAPQLGSDAVVYVYVHKYIIVCASLNCLWFAIISIAIGKKKKRKKDVMYILAILFHTKKTEKRINEKPKLTSTKTKIKLNVFFNTNEALRSTS